MPEIFVIFRDAHFGGHVEKAQYADSRIDQEPAGTDSALFELALQHLVDKGDRVVEIPEKIADTALNRLGCNRTVGLCNRPGHGSVQPHVETVNLAVEAFPWIVLGVRVLVLRPCAGNQHE